MKLVYPIILYPMEEHEGGYTVEVPDLPGCVTEGHDLADALDMARDAASGWILDEMEDGRAVPHASNITDVKPDAFYADAVNWAVASGVTNGTSATTFSPNADCTRAEIVTFLYRAYQGK